MPFSGLHVVCAYAGSGAPQRESAPTLGRPLWSETLATAGSTTHASPGADRNGDAVFHLRASVDAYAAIGPSPNANTGTRVFVPVGEFVTVYTTAGDKLAWVEA